MKCKKGEAAKLYIGSDQFSQGDPGLCWGLFGFSWSLIWHFMNSGTTAKLDASHHAVVVLLRLGAILVLPLARMPLLKLHWQRATSVLPSCVCYLAHLGPHLYSKGSCVRITILAQLPSRDHAVQKRWSCEVVGSDQFSQGDPGLCWGLFGFNWYCWFGISWPLAHLSSIDASHHAVVVLLGLGAILVFPLARMPLLKSYCQRATSVLPSVWPIWAHISTAKGSCVRITTLGQPPASRV